MRQINPWKHPRPHFRTALDRPLRPVPADPGWRGGGSGGLRAEGLVAGGGNQVCAGVWRTGAVRRSVRAMAWPRSASRSSPARVLPGFPIADRVEQRASLAVATNQCGGFPRSPPSETTGGCARRMAAVGRCQVDSRPSSSTRQGRHTADWVLRWPVRGRAVGIEQPDIVARAAAHGEPPDRIAAARPMPGAAAIGRAWASSWCSWP